MALTLLFEGICRLISALSAVFMQTPMEISVDERCRINHLASSMIALSQVLYYLSTWLRINNFGRPRDCRLGLVSRESITSSRFLVWLIIFNYNFNMLYSVCEGYTILPCWGRDFTLEVT